MGFLNNWFGAGNAPKPKGESEFNLYGKQSRESFKSAAKKHKAPYQAMIRRLIDYYVANQRV